MAQNQTVKQKNDTNIATTIQTRQTQVLEKIKSKLGGKELSAELTKLIIEASNSMITMQEKVSILYTHALEKEKYSKEEAKTIVAETMGISVRTAERYIPLEYKDPKYTSNAAKQIQEEKKLGNGSKTQVKVRESQGIYNEGEENDIGETPKDTIKRLSAMWKNSHEITVQGRTFTVTTKSYPDRKVTELDYSEKDIIRALKSIKS
jgi:hypothetical protein